MGYALMWLESVAAALVLFAAALAVCVQATRWKKVSVVLLGLVVVIPVALALILIFTGGSMTFISLAYGKPAMLWLAVFLGGCGFVIVRGLKKQDDVRAASHWPVKILFLFFVVALALNFMTFMNIDARVKASLATIRIEAGAMALSVAPPKILDRDNAALLYDKAFLSVTHANDKMPTSKTKMSDWLKETTDPELREYLKLQKNSLALLKRAAAMPGCYFDRDYSQPNLSMQLPELAHMRSGARLLGMSARSKAADNDIRGAIEDVAAVRGMARHMSAEPLLISGLVAVAIASVANDTLEKILRSVQPSVQDLAALNAEGGISFPRALRRCMIGEQAFGLAAFASISGEGDGRYMYQNIGLEPELDVVLGPIWRVFLLPDDLRSYRRQLNDLRDAMAYRNKYTDYKARAAQFEKNINNTGILTGMLAILSRTYVSFLRAEAQQFLAEAAVAACAYRAKTGAFPPNLESLVPDFLAEVPIDPFDDQPIRFINSGDGATLYSVSDNLKDDGGLNRDPDKGDIVFRIGNAKDTDVPPANANGAKGKGAPPAVKGSF